MLVSLKISFCYSTQTVCFVFLSLHLESYQKCCTLFIIIETHSSKVPVIQLPCINRCICRNAYHPIHVLINLVHAWVHVCTHSCTDEVDTWSWLVDAWSWQKGHEYQEQRVITIKEERERNLPHKYDKLVWIHGHIRFQACLFQKRPPYNLTIQILLGVLAW